VHIKAIRTQANLARIPEFESHAQLRNGFNIDIIENHNG